MRFPELIFGIITLILIGYTIGNIAGYKREKKLRPLIRSIIMSAMLMGFSWIWFVPTYVGQKGENAVCKFRFQVFEFERHDYGTIADWFVVLRPKKYGTVQFYKKIGGWKEYFGIKKVEHQTYREYFGKESDY